MTTTDLKTLGEYLASHDLAAKPVSDYSKKEIVDLVEFIIESFAQNRPIPIMYDHANRLIVPANADKGQLRAAIKMIEALIKWDVPGKTISRASDPHVWEQYQ